MAQPLTKAVIVESIRSELNIPKSSCTAVYNGGIFSIGEGIDF